MLYSETLLTNQSKYKVKGTQYNEKKDEKNIFSSIIEFRKICES